MMLSGAWLKFYTLLSWSRQLLRPRSQTAEFCFPGKEKFLATRLVPAHSHIGQWKCTARNLPSHQRATVYSRLRVRSVAGAIEFSANFFSRRTRRVIDGHRENAIRSLITPTKTASEASTGDTVSNCNVYVFLSFEINSRQLRSSTNAAVVCRTATSRGWRPSNRLQGGPKKVGHRPIATILSNLNRL